jgi:hypothetical protein
LTADLWPTEALGRLALRRWSRRRLSMDGSTDHLSVAQLAVDALALPASARADLTHRLVVSLDESHDDDADAFALREASRRSDEIDRGILRAAAHCHPEHTQRE